MTQSENENDHLDLDHFDQTASRHFFFHLHRYSHFLFVPLSPDTADAP